MFHNIPIVLTVEQAKVVLAKILTYLGRSLLMSLIISFTGYCLLTRKFPPDLSRFKNIYASYQKLSQMSAEIKMNQQARQANPPKSEVDYAGEEKDLELLVAHRRQLYELLSHFNFTQAPLKGAAAVEAKKVADAQAKAEAEAVILPRESYNNLRLQIKNLTEDNEELREQMADIQKRIPSAQVIQSQ